MNTSSGISRMELVKRGKSMPKKVKHRRKNDYTKYSERFSHLKGKVAEIFRVYSSATLPSTRFAGKGPHVLVLH